MIEIFGPSIFSFGFLFFLAVFLDKSLSGKISDTISHYYHRAKSNKTVDDKFLLRDIEAMLKKVIREELSDMFIKYLNERDKKDK